MSKAIVFVGGLAAPGKEWPLTPIRRIARERDWRTYYFRERLSLGPILDSAARLVTFTRKLSTTYDTVVLVGHSMGGLVAETAGALGAPIDGIITVCTPHQGTHPWSRICPLPVVREMATRSGFHEWLASVEGTRPPIMACAAERDLLVPKGTAWPDREHTKLMIPKTGHLLAIFNESAAIAMVDWADAL